MFKFIIALAVRNRETAGSEPSGTGGSVAVSVRKIWNLNRTTVLKFTVSVWHIFRGFGSEP